MVEMGFPAENPRKQRVAPAFDIHQFPIQKPSTEKAGSCYHGLVFYLPWLSMARRAVPGSRSSRTSRSTQVQGFHLL